MKKKEENSWYLTSFNNSFIPNIIGKIFLYLTIGECLFIMFNKSKFRKKISSFFLHILFPPLLYAILQQFYYSISHILTSISKTIYDFSQQQISMLPLNGWLAGWLNECWCWCCCCGEWCFEAYGGYIPKRKEIYFNAKSICFNQVNLITYSVILSSSATASSLRPSRSNGHWSELTQRFPPFITSNQKIQKFISLISTCIGQKSC